MSEVTLFESGLEVGTIDIPTAEMIIGNVWDGMRFVSITANPSTGEDFTAEIVYVF